MHHATKLLQQAVLFYCMKYSPVESKEQIVLLYSDLNTDYLHMQIAGHSYSRSRSCDKCFRIFLIFFYIIHIKE